MKWTILALVAGAAAGYYLGARSVTAASEPASSESSNGVLRRWFGGPGDDDSDSIRAGGCGCDGKEVLR